VAIFLTGSTTSDMAIVDSGFRPASATPAAAFVAVPSTTYRICEPEVTELPNTSATPSGSKSFETIPGS
jgi:hypothetical protein